MTTETQSGSGWKDLTEEERGAKLEAGLQDLEQEEEETPEEPEPEETKAAIELIQDKMEETWTATVLEDVEVSMYQPSESQIQTIRSCSQTYIKTMQAGKLSRLSDELLEDLENMDQTLNVLLGGDPEAEPGTPQSRGVVAEEGMDLEFFEDPDNYPAELRMDLFHAVFERYGEQVGLIKSFRAEQNRE